MSTSKKLDVKLETYPRRFQKHRHAVRRATAAEATSDDPEADTWPAAKKAKPATAETNGKIEASHPRHTNIEFVCFHHLLTVKEIICSTYFWHSHFRANAGPLLHPEPQAPNAKKGSSGSKKRWQQANTEPAAT